MTMTARRRMYDTPLGPRSGWEEAEPTTLQRLYREANACGHVYSLQRAIGTALENNGVADGLEGEISQEHARAMKRAPRGFWLPWSSPIERRDLTTVEGAPSITSVIPPKIMLDILRPKLVVAALGGKIETISEEKGNLQVPIKSSAATVTWVGEGAAPIQSNMIVSSLTMTPRSVFVYTDVTRRMLNMSTPDFQAHVVSDLTTGLGVAIDAAALVGQGPAANQPTGLLSTPGIPSLPASGGTLTYSHLVAMQEAARVANADALADTKMSWLTSPAGRSTLQETDMSTTGQGRFCWKSTPLAVGGEVVNVETVLGERAASTTLIPATGSTSLIHGDFSRAWVNLFSGIDILLDSYTFSRSGTVRITAYVDCDAAFPTPASFVICGNVGEIVPT